MLLLAGALEARLHRYRVYPNRSIEILAIAEGPGGVLWLGAADGLYSFDGFRYSPIAECPLPSVYFLARGTDGALWAASPAGLVRHRGGKFERITRKPVVGLEAAGDRILVALQRQLTTVEPDGSLKSLAKMRRGVITAEASGRVWYQCPDSTNACSLDSAEITAVPGEFEQFIRDARGRFWAAEKDRAVLIESGRVTGEHRRRPSQRTSRPGPLRLGREDRVWFIGETIRELASGQTFDDGGALEDYQATAGFEDSRGRLWVAKLNLGLVRWTPDPAWEHWNTRDFGGASPVQIVRTRSGEIVVATRANLHVRDRNSWKPLAAETRDYAAILPLDDGGFLASVRKTGLVRLDREGRIVERVPDPSGLPDSYRLLIRDAKGRVWVGHKLALYRVDKVGGTLRLAKQALPASAAPVPDQAVDFDLDAHGRLWCGYQHGVAWLDEAGNWRRLETDRPVQLVRSIAVGPEGVWAGYRMAGPFSLLKEAAGRWIVTDFAPADGYPPVDTHFMARDSRGWIWRGSTEGVHVFDGQGDPRPDHWLHLSRRDSFAVDTTGQYGFFEDRDGSVWLAGEEGLAHVMPGRWWFIGQDAPPVRVSRFEESEGIIRVEMGSLDTPEFRPDPLRYRLRPQFDDWRSGGGTLEFSYLPRGAYTLEVAYAGAEAAGPALSHAFQVGATGPPWWQSLALPLAGTASVFLLVRRSRMWQRAGYWLSKSVYLARRRWRTRAGETPEAAVAGSQAGATLFGRYHLLRPISHGGFSIVYEGRDLENPGARVAVKILRASQPGNERWLRDRFAQEVAALRSVRHECIVPVLDSWVSLEGEPCLAMPLLEGPTLRAVLAAGPLTPRAVASFARQVGSALREVHRLGIVHRDLKPENLIRTGDDRWVMIDFGTAGLRGPGSALAATTLVSGSLAYMAPEQLTGHYSPASDLYAFALLILESLTGKRLSELQSISSEAAFAGELEAMVGASIEPGPCARSLAALLCEAFRPEPARRPGDVNLWASEVAERLESSEAISHPA
jgi:hypothetical protein